VIAAVRRLLLLLATVFGLLLAVPAAQAAPRSAIIRDCEDDSKLSGTYTAKELRDARSNLPSDKDAYSDCRDVLGAALAVSAARGRARTGGTGSEAAGNALEGPAGGAGTGTGAGGGTGSGASTALPPAAVLDLAPGAAPIAVDKQEKQALREARAASPGIDSRGRPTASGVRGLAGQAATATIPTSLVAVLVLLGVTIVLAAVPYVRRRVLRRRAA
jgi:hypothetical protein